MRPIRWSVRVAVLGLVAWSACVGTTSEFSPDASIDASIPDAALPDAAVPDASTPDASTPDASVVPVPGEVPDLPNLVPAVVAASPTSPPSEDSAPFGGPAAPLLEGVQVAANRDSAIVVLPVVTGAVDYRAFRLPAGARVTSVNGGEQVNGTVIHCAGYQQHNDKYSGRPELLRQLEVTDLSQPTDVVVEAIDSACPFPGLRASTHSDFQVTIDEVPVADRVTFSFFTEAEIRARFGSLIVNGHGKGATLAAPAPPTTPRVLARTTITVTPTGRATPRTKDFFDDFDGTGGALASAGIADDGGRCHAKGRRFENAKWEFFIYNDHGPKAEAVIDKGQLHVVLPDWEQDVFASVIGVPRRAAKLSTTTYLHLTFEVASNATARRYWWVGLCGAGAAGQTFDANNRYRGHFVLTPFFYQSDGYNPTLEQWNCLQFFPRDGSPFELAGTRTQSDIRVMVNTADVPARESVVNLSPPQYAGVEKPSWFLQRTASGGLGAPILDDQLRIAPRTRFDAYVRRDRVVLFVNGQQRLCNELGAHPLTMAEAAVGVGQVLYHSAAERVEFSRSYNDRTGQRYYLENAPYADERDWDNVGYEEEVSLPASFDPRPCYAPP